jgi:hypothetical protein
MRYFGTLVRSEFNEALWVFNVEHRLAELPPQQRVVVIDSRYPNEIALVRRLGGHIEQIKRGEDPWWLEAARMVFAEPDAARRQAMIQGLQNLVHDSEWAWLECGVDGVTSNDGTIADLQSTIAAKFAN